MSDITRWWIGALTGTAIAGLISAITQPGTLIAFFIGGALALFGGIIAMNVNRV